MILRKLVLGLLDTNCYILTKDKGKEGFVIDPADNISLILSVCAEEKTKPAYILCTHGHPDHVGVAFELASKTGAVLALHKEDEKLLNSTLSSFFLSALIRKPLKKPGVPIKWLNDGEVLKANGLELKIIHTPGHTEGSISALTDNLLFTGDLLFAGSVGRCDLPGGDYKKLMISLKDKIAILPDSIKIYPGHGPATTLLKEKGNNPFLREALGENF